MTMVCMYTGVVNNRSPMMPLYNVPATGPENPTHNITAKLRKIHLPLDPQTPNIIPRHIPERFPSRQGL